MSTKNLLKEAWEARELACLWRSKTKVGCAIECEDGEIVTGFNIDGLWMTSIHAEVNAVCNLARKNQRGKKIAIVAKVDFFTPCGACLDWLFQFCDSDIEVIIQNKNMETRQFKLKELCPYYPRR